MVDLRWPPTRWLALALALLLVASCGLMSMLTAAAPASSPRLAAQQRWAARPFSSYRIAIRVDYGGSICTQELETKGEYLRRILRNNCRPSWLGLSTVLRLFEIGERLDRPQPCYALSQVCSCYRVLQGDIAYDTQLGYPAAIAYRREIRPNFLHADYWRRLLTSRQLPNCALVNQSVTIMVTAITPIQ